MEKAAGEKDHLLALKNIGVCLPVCSGSTSLSQCSDLLTSWPGRLS